MNDIDKAISRMLPHGAWCSKEKAKAMMEIIIRDAPQITVEIGVFAGDTLFLIAKAVQLANNGGKVFGIDSWSAGASIDGMVVGGTNHVYWSKINYDSIHKLAKTRLHDLYKLGSVCELIQSLSDDPAMLGRFTDGSVGFLHLDGNHSAPHPMNDVKAWLPKLASWATIVVDDVNWVEGGEWTVRLAMEWLLANGCDYMVDEEGEPIAIGQSVFLKRLNAQKEIPSA